MDAPSAKGPGAGAGLGRLELLPVGVVGASDKGGVPEGDSCPGWCPPGGFAKEDPLAWGPAALRTLLQTGYQEPSKEFLGAFAVLKAKSRDTRE